MVAQNTQRAAVWKRVEGFFKRNGIVIIFFAAILVYTFSKGIFGGYTLSPTNFLYSTLPWSSEGVSITGPYLTDPVDQVLPSLYSAYSSSDSISLWDSHIAFGSPTELFHLLFPLEWLYSVFPNMWYTIDAVLKFAIALVSMYLLLRSYELEQAACIVGSCLFAFSSTMVVWLFWPHTNVICLTPLLFLACKKLFERLLMRYACWFAIVFALMLLGGMPTYAAYYMYLLGAYMVFLSIKHRNLGWRSLLKFWLLFVLGVVLGVLISLPYTVQLLSSVGSNGYAESRAGQSSTTLTLGYLRTLFFPYERDGLTYHINESTLYTGLLSMLLIVFGFVRQREKRRSDNLFWSLAWVVMLLLIFTHSLDFVFTRLPAVNTSSKIRVITLYNFVTSIFTAITLDDIVKNRGEYRRHPLLVCLGFVPPIGVLIFAAARYVSDVSAIVSVVVVTTLMIGALLLIVFLDRRQAYIVGVCLLLLASGYDVATFAAGYLPWISGDAEVVPEATDTIEYLEENSEEGERYVSVGSTWMLFSNVNGFYELYTIEAHGFVNTNEDMQEFLSAICEDAYQSSTLTAISSIDDYDLLRYAGVQYLVTASGDDEFEGYELVYSGDDGLYVYEDVDCADRAYLAEDVEVLADEDEVLDAMAESYEDGSAFLVESELTDGLELSDVELSDDEGVEIVEYENDVVTLEVTVEMPRLLVLSDYYDDDWVVSIDGEETDLLECNYLFRGVYLDEAGTYTVTFEYRPTSTYALLLLSVLSLIVTLCIIIVSIVRSKAKAAFVRVSAEGDDASRLPEHMAEPDGRAVFEDSHTVSEEKRSESMEA